MLVTCVQFFVTLWTVAHQPLCPWDSPGKNTGVGSHSVLQGIFLTQGSNSGLLHCSQILYHLSHQGSWIMGGKSIPISPPPKEAFFVYGIIWREVEKIVAVGGIRMIS